jgi:hypothetical protein
MLARRVSVRIAVDSCERVVQRLDGGEVVLQIDYDHHYEEQQHYVVSSKPNEAKK